VMFLLNNPEKREELSIAGRERMLQNHHWPNSMNRLDQIVERCVNKFKH